jgi:hypothetical protein
MRKFSETFHWAPSLILIVRASKFAICDCCTIRTDLTLIVFYFEMPPLPLLKFGLLLRVNFWANSKSFLWQHGEHLWWKCGCWNCSTGCAIVASADLGSSLHIHSWVKDWTNQVVVPPCGQNQVVVPPCDQLQQWRHHCWQCSRSNMKLLCGISGNPTANFCWSKWAAGSRPLAPHHWV